jgi:hypothetical protein
MHLIVRDLTGIRSRAWASEARQSRGESLMLMFPLGLNLHKELLTSRLEVP